MRRFRAINLIAFCALVLLADDSASLSHILREFPDILKGKLATLRQGIVPGTLWCGPGHIASNYSQLGGHRQLDTCCRAHDFCKDYIQPRTSKYGLFNSAYVCRSSLCECEVQFYDCLKKTSDMLAFYIGKIYFKACKKCFDPYYDIGTCLKKGLVLREEVGRNGSHVFCAQFNRNPKWAHSYNVAMPESIPAAASPSWIDRKPERTVPPSYPVDDDQNASDDENYDENYDEDYDENYERDFDKSMLNIF